MSREKKRPNIVFILADDMGYGDVSGYGATKIQTPRIDHMIKEGAMFTDAHSSSAVCTPSRYSIMTGRYCWRTWKKQGVIGGHSPALIEEGRETIASALKKAGYQTACFGKWHLGFNWRLKDGSYIHRDTVFRDYDFSQVDYEHPLTGGPVDVGFDYYYGISGSLDMPPYCFIENRQTVGIPDREKEVYYPQQKQGFTVEGWEDTTVDMTIVEKAKAYIKNHVDCEGDTPFFTYIPLVAPHRPCVPAEAFRGKSQAGLRGDMCMEVDWCVGEIVDALQQSGILENTLIIFSSDNGARPADVDGIMHGHKSCGEWRGYKTDIWEGGHRVPFVMYWPEGIKPSVISRTVSLMDVMATVCQVVDVPLGDDAGEDSYSFLPLLSQPDGEIDRKSLIHHSGRGMFSIRRGHWKYVEGFGSGGVGCEAYQAPPGLEGQLYDLMDDPWEMSNHYKRYPEKVEELRQELERIRQKGTSKYEEA